MADVLTKRQRHPLPLQQEHTVEFTVVQSCMSYGVCLATCTEGERACTLVLPESLLQDATPGAVLRTCPPWVQVGDSSVTYILPQAMVLACRVAGEAPAPGCIT